MRKSRVFSLVLIASTTMLSPGCGGSSSPEGDGDVAVDDVSTPDEVQQDHPGDVPAEEAPHETQDLPAEQADGQEDSPGDAPADLPAEETAPDAVDAAEEDATGLCRPLTGTIEDVYSWTQAWMGTGTIATFTLNLSNANGASDPCDFSGIEAVEGVLKRASDGAPILTYATITPAGAMDTSLGPGESSATGFRTDHPDSTTAECDSDVIVEVSVDYMIGGVPAPPVKIESGPAQHLCVY